jgi:hypothetical protein
MNVSKVTALLLAASFAVTAYAASPAARFDLIGPKVEVRVTRGSTTLPIAQVPNLQPGDKLWVKVDLPPNQSNHLLLIVAFLRGTTNEPPDNWFTEIDTWDKKAIEGTNILVPKDAQQAVMFIAPETGGDFKTLRSAVKGKPGLFIRADSDLNEASFEQQRIERYITEMKKVPQTDAKAIQDHSAKLAATLALKPNAKCFKEPVDQQLTCLTQSSAPVLLADGHGQGVAEALTTGASSDFMNAASTTPTAGGGLYSAYVGTVIDLVHLVSLLKTAQYQYIPGLSFPKDDTLNLKLNAPPSFHNPKTVIVIGLPAIQSAKLPPLHPPDPNQGSCLLKPKMTLMLEGAPLVFSTSYAHNLVLHLNEANGATDLPLTPDAYEGGLIVTQPSARKPLTGSGSPSPAAPVKPGAKPGSGSDLIVTGTVQGYWGFDTFKGPTVNLQQLDGKNWKIVGNTQLIAGKDTQLTLKGDGTACVEHIVLTNGKDKDINVNFKPAADKGAKSPQSQKNTLALDVSLKTVKPGGYSLAIQQYGESTIDKVPLTAYNGNIKFDDIHIHAGDNSTQLTGQGIQGVVSVEIAGQTFKPSGNHNTDKSIYLQSPKPVTPQNNSTATVTLKDGRKMPVKVDAEAARPGLKLLSFKATPAQQTGALAITLGAKDDIPLNGKLHFVVQTANVFPHTQTIEVATANEAVHTSLSLSASDLVLQDEHTAIATLDPLKAFGRSAFGKLQIRPVAADGTHGDWTPLGTLVRTPKITAINCTTQTAPTCQLNGSSLFLVQSFSATKDFAKPTAVPTGFAENTFNVPTPADGVTLFLKLRDDPTHVATVTLPAPIQKPDTPSPQNPPSSAPQPKPIMGSKSSTTAPQPPSASPSPTPPAPAQSTTPKPN